MQEALIPERGDGAQAKVEPGVAEPTALHLTGMLLTRWQPLAVALQQAVQQSAMAGSEAKPCQVTVATMGASSPGGTKSVLFVAHPARALCSHWQSAGASPPEPLLRTWCDEARQSLRRAHGAPSQHLLVDMDEAWSNLKGLEAAFVAWSGLDLRPGWPAQPLSDDAGLLWMAQQFCSSDRRAVDLYEELLASCAALPGGASVAPEAVAIESAVSRYCTLLDIESSQQEQSEQRAVLLMNLHETQLCAEEAQDRIKGVQVEAEAQIDLLLAQLHVVQADLEAGLQRQQDLATAVQTEQQRADQVQALLDAERSRRAAVDVGALQEALRDRERLADQLYRAMASGQTVPSTGSHTEFDLSLPAAAGSVTITQVVDSAPHRELHLAASGVPLGERVHDHLRLKLVEHQGRPGVVLLDTPGVGTPLSQWQPTGREADTDFMLLVPGDLHGRSVLERLGSTDWQTLLALSEWLRVVIADHSASLAPHWPSVAGRFAAQLRAAPPRLRYDTLQTSLDAKHPSTLEVTLRGVVYGLDTLPDITLWWRVDGQGPAIAWALPQQDPTQPPLAAWPAEDDGRLAALCPWPLGSGSGRLQRMRWWHALTQHEFDLLMGLIDALRAAAVTLAGTSAQPWMSAAKRLHRQARQARRWGGLAAAIRARLR